ncbi:MAG: ABC transporter substrate-binding protein [Chloroflexota bacterium]
MSRRRFIGGSVAGATLGLLSGCDHVRVLTRRRTGVPRVGYLAPDNPPTSASRAFVQSLRDMGYVDGQNIEIVYRGADGQEERLRELAADLVRLPVDAILAQTAVAARAAKDATSTIPIVISGSNDPVEAGLVASLARPGGNVTGLSLASPAIIAKRLQLLTEVAPSATRIASLVYAPGATVDRDWSEAQIAGRTLGLQLARYDVGSGDDFSSAFAAIAADGTDALLLVPNQFFSRNRERLLDLVRQNRLPAMYTSSQDTAPGGLMSYGADISDTYYRSATYMDKILKGANPADLPIEQPTKFDLSINLKTAAAQGITIPSVVLAQATEVIQ